ncbi:hypothetical protein ACFSC6_05670 [Rufibacter sediminis]|uniref:Multidrug transporter n=1 Tax=Rufibacter sediminis TaxID=2762756 RepID=A0ABR6VPQ7_9BACT|nr:hypothetical protein [Rufibacter sediminis]MBC3539178.1 hypothetical protein [Rufibacter sediminis]
MEDLLTIYPKKLFPCLLKAFLVVISLSLIAISLDHYFKNIAHNQAIATSYTFKTYVVGMFDSNGEKNIPTYFSFLNLIISAVLLGTIGKVVKDSNEPRYYKRWYLLGCLFIFLALDELLMLHEIMGLPFIALLKFINNGNEISFVRFTGFIPYFLVGFFSFAYFLNWFLALPRRTMISFVVSGLVVVFGALGVEMIGEYLIGIYGKYSFPYKAATTFEESFEMLGIIYFIKALIDYLETKKETISLGFDFRNGQKSHFASEEATPEVNRREKHLI